jgi:hypothetical protein
MSEKIEFIAEYIEQRAFEFKAVTAAAAEFFCPSPPHEDASEKIFCNFTRLVKIFFARFSCQNASDASTNNACIQNVITKTKNR